MIEKEKKVIRKIFKKERKGDNNTSNYTSKYEVEKLFVSFVIVTRYQGSYFVDKFIDLGVSSSFIVFGKGTAPSEMIYALGLPESKKDVVITVFKESMKDKINEIIEERFNFSSSSKGVSFIIPLDSVMGLLSYRFMSDTKVNRRKENGK